jgi:hypothetical protein
MLLTKRFDADIKISQKNGSRLRACGIINILVPIVSRSFLRVIVTERGAAARARQICLTASRALPAGRCRTERSDSDKGLSILHAH